MSLNIFKQPKSKNQNRPNQETESTKGIQLVGDDPRLFCICEGCDTKIFRHAGFEKTEEGLYKFFIICENCGKKFYHISGTKKAQTKKQAKQLTPLIKEIMKGLQKGEYEDEEE